MAAGILWTDGAEGTSEVAKECVDGGEPGGATGHGSASVGRRRVPRRNPDREGDARSARRSREGSPESLSA
jgi:hypothetical protein